MSTRGIVLCIVLASSHTIFSQTRDPSVPESTVKKSTVDILRNMSCQTNKLKQDIIQEFRKSINILNRKVNNYNERLLERTTEIVYQAHDNVTNHMFDQWRLGKLSDHHQLPADCSAIFNSLEIKQEMIINRTYICLSRKHERFSARILRRRNGFHDKHNDGQYYRDPTECDTKNYLSIIDPSTISESSIRENMASITELNSQLTRQKASHIAWLRRILNRGELSFKLCRRFKDLNKQARTVANKTIECIDRMSLRGTRIISS